MLHKKTLLTYLESISALTGFVSHPLSHCDIILAVIQVNDSPNDVAFWKTHLYTPDAFMILIHPGLIHDPCQQIVPLKSILPFLMHMETGKSWFDVLPAVWCEIHMTPSSTTK